MDSSSLKSLVLLYLKPKTSEIEPIFPIKISTSLMILAIKLKDSFSVHKLRL